VKAILGDTSSLGKKHIRGVKVFPGEKSENFIPLEDLPRDVGEKYLEVNKNLDFPAP